MDQDKKSAGAEEEQKPKRKTTLIKHRAPKVQDKDAASEKKKVVVVKKKVVKVKKTTSDTKPVAPVTEEKTTIVEEKKSTKPGYLGHSPRERSPFEVQRELEEVKATGTIRKTASKPETRAQKTEERPPIRESKAGDDARRRSDYRRSPSGTRPPARQFRKGGATEAPTQRHRSETKTTFRRISEKKPAPATTAPSGRADEGKPAGKKFFKTKHRGNYKGKRKAPAERIDKAFDKKKKDIQKTNPVPKEVDILEAISVSELARKMNLKASDLIAKLMEMGMMVTINQQIDSETASILADEYGCKINVVSLYDETVIEEEEQVEEDIRSRPPVVTIMGHVDHGKTLLLDVIREANVVASEIGGITQHIGAYTVESPQGKIVFLDTPGHEAFTAMRARGAQVTDIVVLVVAANDGVMPQTVEAINHAKEAKVPIIVAINKIDLPDANSDRVKQQLAEFELMPEDWGGHTLFSEISALKKTGIDNLLDNILLQAEILELNANYTCRAQGRVLESKVDHGRGIVSTVLIEKGTLSIGDAFVAGVFPGHVRAIFNDRGDKMAEATPSIPVEILGFTGLPNAGDPFHVTEDAKFARMIGSKRQELKKMEETQNVGKVTLDNLYDQIKRGELQELKVIVKGDVHGSVEALQSSLERLSTEEIRLSVIHASAGAINDNDVIMAVASEAIIIGFHVRPTPSAQSLAEREKVEIRRYSIIYEAVDSIRAAMEGMLAPELKEASLGTLEVRDTFRVPRIGVIAGCYVNSGKITRGSQVHLVRDGIEVYTGTVSSLRRFKDDAREVESGFECGVGIENYDDIKVGDLIEVYEIQELAKKLDVG